MYLGVIAVSNIGMVLEVITHLGEMTVFKRLACCVSGWAMVRNYLHIAM